MTHFSMTARTRLLALAGMIVLLTACAKQPVATAPAAAQVPAMATVATVDGTPISRGAFDFYVKSLTGGKATAAQLTPEQKNQVIDELISMQLMAEQGLKDGVQKDPDTAAQLEVTRMHLLADAASQKYLKDKQPTDQELHAEYDSAVAAMDKTEYHARHILVASKVLAEELTKRIKAGANFGELAKTQSIDSSKTNGGDLGWFSASGMAKPFADAVKSLKKGEVTPEPVQTKFGWHIIQLLDTRPVTPPPFDQVKAQLVNHIMQKKLQAYVDQLKNTAKITKTN